MEPQAGGSAAGLGSGAGSRGGRTRRRPGAGSEEGASSCNRDRDEGAQSPRLQGRASETPWPGSPHPGARVRAGWQSVPPKAAPARASERGRRRSGAFAEVTAFACSGSLLQ